ncbi:MAG: cytochrome b/b6 domain-containing protein [Rhodospirillales bacterium]|nr:cytochrome b/b6 domain-containing protein [Rhodospirillales bacterium]
MTTMRPARAAAARYDSTSILLHWLTAGLVAALWTSGQTTDFWPRGTARTAYISVHVLLGMALGAVILIRLAWRRTGGARIVPEGPALLAKAATGVHHLLYALVVTTVTLGLLFASARGFQLFGSIALPVVLADFKRTLGSWHGLAANAVVILAGLHAAAALGHHYLLRDGTLRRMLPVRRPG